MKPHDEYKKVETPYSVHCVACPVCGSGVEVWRHSESPDSPTETAVCCTNGIAFGPQVGEISAGCLLYMPPLEFYKGTIREAVRYWNEYAVALESQRKLKLATLPNTERTPISTVYKIEVEAGTVVVKFPEIMGELRLPAPSAANVFARKVLEASKEAHGLTWKDAKPEPGY